MMHAFRIKHAFRMKHGPRVKLALRREHGLRVRLPLRREHGLRMKLALQREHGLRVKLPLRREHGLWMKHAFRSLVLFGFCSTLAPLLPGSSTLGRLAGQAVRVEPPPVFMERLREEPEFQEVVGGWKARTAAAVRQSESLTGTMPVAIILALFADSPEPHVEPWELQAALFDGPTPYGTVSGFYHEVSGGRFQVSGQVSPWVRTSLTMAEVVGESYGLGEDARTGQYLLEALAAVDSLMDFGRFDNDGPDGVPNSGDDDGRVDAVAFQFLEVGASCGGPSIWPHRWWMEGWTQGNVPYQTDDLRPDGTPVVVSDYTTQGATDCGGLEIQKATTIAHELGHVLGLPDLYDSSRGIEPQYRRWVVGCWSLMAAGSWGCGTEDRLDWVRPTHPGAWEKEILGWVEVERVGSFLDRELSLAPVQEGGRVLKIPLEPDPPGGIPYEYLLVEYRTQEGFDLGLPASGVLLYHVDPKISGNRPCDTCPQRYRVALLEADGNNSLRRTFLEGGNRGEPGDAWGVWGEGRLTPNTQPSSRLNSGDPSAVTIYRLAVENGEARIRLGTRQISLSSLTQPLLASWATPLTQEEEAFLDTWGNGNGIYDVGDFRAYLRR